MLLRHKKTGMWLNVFHGMLEIITEQCLEYVVLEHTRLSVVAFNIFASLVPSLLHFQLFLHGKKLGAETGNKGDHVVHVCRYCVSVARDPEKA